MRHLSLIALLYLAAIIPVAAQDKALITGDAEDQHDKPIPGLRVTLRNEALRVERETTTDSDGIYFFADVSPAEGYVISADATSVKFTPDILKFDIQVGEQRQVLPPFISTPAISAKRRTKTLPAATAGLSHKSNSATADPARAVLRPARFNQTPETVGQANSPAGQREASGSAPQMGSSGQIAASQPVSRAITRNSQIAQSVQSSTVPLDYISTASSSVITANQLRGLPFFNRNFLVLGLLAPSTHDVPAGSELKDATFSISGQRPTSNAFLLDGMDNVASSSNQAIPFQVNDAIQEFRVVSSTADAQFGRNMGGVVNVITQRGTAKFHGSAFGFFASDALSASSPLSVYSGTGFSQAAAFAGALNASPAQVTGTSPNPIYEPTSYNQYVSTVRYMNDTYQRQNCTVPGATVQDPLNCYQQFNPNALLAQHDSHTQPFSSQQFGARAGGSFLKRWYWFGDYEGTRIDNPNPIFERVPSSYDKSHFCASPDQQGCFYAPGMTGYDDAKVAYNVLSLYPHSNVVAVPHVLEFYQGQAPNFTNVDNYLARFDFDQSSNTNWTLRYNVQRLSQLHDDTLPNSSYYPGNGAQRAALNQNLALSLTHQLSSAVTNVIRGGFTRFQVTETPQDVNFNPSQLGLPAGQMQTFLLSGLDPQYSGASQGVLGGTAGWVNAVWLQAFGGSPYITPSLDGLFPFARIGAPLSAPGKRRDSEIEFIDNLAISRGRHFIRVGGDLRWLQNIFNNGGYSRGFVVSSNIGEFTSDSETGSFSGPSFSNPSFDYAMRQPAPYNTDFHSYSIAGYVQDTWRIKSNLTVNLGLRYEFFSPPSEANHQLWNFDPAANGLVQQGTSQVVDPYGAACGTGTISPNQQYASYNLLSYPAYLGATSQWNCATKGNGSFLVSNKTNFEPRVGIAWSTPDGATVLRAGFGVFRDQIAASNTAQLTFNRPTNSSLSSPQAIYGQNFGIFESSGFGNTSLNGVSADNRFFQSASIPFGINAIDPNHFSNPRNLQITGSVERQITRKLAAEVDYIGDFMQNLPVTSNLGFNDEWFCTASAPGCDSFSLIPRFTLANRGYGNYNALVARLKTSDWHGLQAQLSYTYSKALDNGSGASQPLIPAPLMTQVQALQAVGQGSLAVYSLGQSQFNLIGNVLGIGSNPFGVGSLTANLAGLTGLLTQGLTTTGAGQVHVTPYTVPQDPYNFLKNDYGPSDYNQTNRLVLEYTWDIPVAKRSQLFDGWSLSGVFNAESGQPFTIFVGPVAGELTQRVNLAGPVTTTGNAYAYIGNTGNISMPSASCANTAAANSNYALEGTVGLFGGVAGTPCLGTSSRNQFTGPAYVDYNMAVQKLFRIRERVSLILRAESYNLFNRANFYNPISTYSLDGATLNPQFGQIQSAHNPRQFQFAARVSW